MATTVSARPLTKDERAHSGEGRLARRRSGPRLLGRPPHWEPVLAIRSCAVGAAVMQPSRNPDCNLSKLQTRRRGDDSGPCGEQCCEALPVANSAICSRISSAAANWPNFPAIPKAQTARNTATPRMAPSTASCSSSRRDRTVRPLPGPASAGQRRTPPASRALPRMARSSLV